MSSTDKVGEHRWKDAPSEFWIVPSPNNWIGGNAGESTPPAFASQKRAEDYAKKQSQTNDCYYRVYRITLHGTAIPQDSQFMGEA